MWKWGRPKKVCCLILFQEAQSYADENSLLFMETSAKTAMNVNDIFLAIGNALFGVGVMCTLAI